MADYAAVVFYKLGAGMARHGHGLTSGWTHNGKWRATVDEDGQYVFAVVL